MSKPTRQHQTKPRKIVLRRAPGDKSPFPFGYKRSWIATPATDPVRLAELLGRTQIEPCSWSDGLRRSYNLEGVFITPTVNGWTIAVGSIPEAGTQAFSSLMRELSREFGSAFYFGTHRIVGYHAWAHAENGTIRRAFAYLGERGEFLANVGVRTADEVALDTGMEDLDHAPNEETVLDLAGKWLLDPRRINEYPVADGPGHFAR